MRTPPQLPPGFYLKQLSVKQIWKDRGQWEKDERGLDWNFDYYRNLPDVTDVDEHGWILVYEGIDPLTGKPIPAVSIPADHDADPYAVILYLILKRYEHEALEWFQINGNTPYDPHSRETSDLNFINPKVLDLKPC